MKQNKFDLVMEYIDENVSQDIETIKKGIYNLIGYSSLSFGNCFTVLTGQTLFHYINERKMYFAAQSLIADAKRSIADIALEFGYSEQSAFSRAFKLYCNATPLEVRKGASRVLNRKYKLATICDANKQPDNRMARIAKEFEETGDLSIQSERYLEALNEASQEGIFDIDTCAAIFDLADRLEIPSGILLSKCEDIVIALHSDPNYLPPRIEIAIDCGISSDEELMKICDYYNCKYYDLDKFMVDAYREQLSLK